MAAVKVNFDEGDLAAIDRVRGDVPRERWIRRLCMDGVAAAENFASTRPARVAAPPADSTVALVAEHPDPEDGPLSYDAERDEPIREATGHDGQPCRCPECTALREAYRERIAAEPERYVSPFVGPGAKTSNLKDVIG